MEVTMLRKSTTMAENGSHTATDDYITRTYVMPVLWDDEKRAAITEEHRLNPIGVPGKNGVSASIHSPDLARVLDKLRRAPLPGKEVRVELDPFKKYAIGLLPGKRGEDVTILEDAFYATADECEHAVFLRRVENMLKRYPKPQS
jgi:hypothetical protein